VRRQRLLRRQRLRFLLRPKNLEDRKEFHKQIFLSAFCF
jgi:hypothetical protein